jgi:hypothetical protein
VLRARPRSDRERGKARRRVPSLPSLEVPASDVGERMPPGPSATADFERHRGAGRAPRRCRRTLLAIFTKQTLRGSFSPDEVARTSSQQRRRRMTQAGRR